eukprot:SAG31_NODE_3525_length_4157_cov_5.449013_1_plen_259_part_10
MCTVAAIFCLGVFPTASFINASLHGDFKYYSIVSAALCLPLVPAIWFIDRYRLRHHFVDARGSCQCCARRKSVRVKQVADTDANALAGLGMYECISPAAVQSQFDNGTLLYQLPRGAVVCVSQRKPSARSAARLFFEGWVSEYDSSGTLLMRLLRDSSLSDQNNRGPACATYVCSVCSAARQRGSTTSVPDGAPGTSTPQKIRKSNIEDDADEDDDENLCEGLSIARKIHQRIDAGELSGADDVAQPVGVLKKHASRVY